MDAQLLSTQRGRRSVRGMTDRQILALPQDQQQRLLEAMVRDYVRLTGDSGWYAIFGINPPVVPFVDPVAEAVERINRQGKLALERLSAARQLTDDAATVVSGGVIYIPVQIIEHILHARNAKPVDHRIPTNWFGGAPTPPGKGKKHRHAKRLRAGQCPWRHIQLNRPPNMNAV